MAVNEAQLVRLLEVQLSVHGFKRSKKLWYLESEDIYAILELDKGTWGGNYHLELTVMVKALDNKPPKSAWGHLLGWGVDDLVPDKMQMRAAVNLSDVSMTSDEKDECIRIGLNEYAIPFLKRVRTVEGLKEELRENKRLRYHTSKLLWDHLGLDVDRTPKLD